MRFVLAEDNIQRVNALKSALEDNSVVGTSVVISEVDQLVEYLQAANPAKSDGKVVLFLKDEIKEQDAIKILPSLRLAGLLNQVFVVVLTEKMSPARLRRAYSLGANSFLEQPVNSTQLRDLIEAFPQFFPQQSRSGTNGAPARALSNSPSFADSLQSQFAA